MGNEPKPSHFDRSRDAANSRQGKAVAAFIFGIVFLLSAMLVRGGLHDEVSPGIVIWLTLGAWATYLSLKVWRPHIWPGFSILLRRTGAFVTLSGWILGGFIYYVPHDPHALDQRMQGRCQDHLEQLGFLIADYTDDHGGKYPDRPEVLIEEGIGSDIFVCPSTRDTPAQGSTPADIADAFASGGHMSYIYVGKGLTKATTQPSTVLMYESTRNHTRDNPGIHVLYADERVEYLQGDAAMQLILNMWHHETPPPSTSASSR